MTESEWTISALKEYVDKLREADKEAVTTALAAAEKAVNAALISSEKAINKAEGAADDRFKAANEIRGAMRDAQATFANKGQTQLQMDSLARRVEALEKNEVRTSGRQAGAAGLYGYILSGIMALLAFVAWANGRLG